MQKLNKNKNIFDHRNCLSKEELISYAKGSLSDKEKHHVEKHLLDCELCTESLEGILLLSDPAKLNNISREMIRRLAEQNPSSKKNKIRPAYLAAAAVTCLLIVSGIYFAFIRNPENLKSEMAVAPLKDEEIKSVTPPSPAVSNSIEESGDATLSTGETESNRAENISEPQSKKSSQQTLMIAPETVISQKENEVSVPQQPAEMYNGTLAAAEKAKEELPVLADKKSIPAQDQAKMGIDAPPATDSFSSMASGDYPTEKNAGVVSMSEPVSKKSSSAASRANMDDGLKNVKRNMETDNFKDALTELNQLSKVHPADMNVVYHTGLVYYKTNETVNALNCFDQVINSGDKKLFEDARLHKALTYVKMNDKLNARKILSYIISEKGIYKKRAEGILEQMDGN